MNERQIERMIERREPHNCYICGRFGKMQNHHMIHGNGRRNLADEDGLCVWLCMECHSRLHSTGAHDLELKQEAERRWMMDNPEKTIEDFIERYGKNYLED